MVSGRKNNISKLLKEIETADPDSVSVVNDAQYIPHNPPTHGGNLGLTELFKEPAKTCPRLTSFESLKLVTMFSQIQNTISPDQILVSKFFVLNRVKLSTIGIPPKLFQCTANGKTTMASFN